MEVKFDQQGFLEPHRKISMDVTTLKAGFVNGFDLQSTRHELFIGFVRYNEQLKQLLRENSYTQWINGSFISLESNPGDIDLVNLIDFRLVDKYETELLSFINQASNETYGIDGYIVRIYPHNHPKIHLTKSDLAYWEHWFTRSKKNRRRQRFPKGFVEIKQ